LRENGYTQLELCHGANRRFLPALTRVSQSVFYQTYNYSSTVLQESLFGSIKGDQSVSKAEILRSVFSELQLILSDSGFLLRKSYLVTAHF